MELLGRERSRERSGSTIMEDFDLIKTLDSSRQDEVSEVTAIMKDMLAKYREPWLLNTLVDYYFQTGSSGALEILKSIKQIQAQNFFEKLHNCLQKSCSIKLRSLMLLANVINEQAGWLYQIVDTPVFTAIVKLLKASTNMTILMSAILTLTALLPLAPSYIAHHLPDLFEVFSRLAAWRSGNNPTVPEVHLLHLDVAMYYYFVQLYTMYPCNFMDYLKARYGPKGEVYIFKRHIAPLLKHVRMHPELVYQSTDYEKEKIKWCTMEPDEIAALSSDVSLDPLINSDSQLLQSLALSADTSLREKLNTISQLPMEATDGAKPLVKPPNNHENGTLSQHKASWPKVTVSRVSASKSNESYSSRKPELVGHKRRHSYSDSTELPNYVSVVQTGDTKFSPSVLLGLHPSTVDQQLSRHSSYISTTSSGATTTNLASPFCGDTTTHAHNPLHGNYSPTASVRSYNIDAPLQCSCTSDDSTADMFRYPDFSRSLPAPVSMNLSGSRQSKNLVNSMTVMEKQNPLKAAVNRLIGMISRRSSDQQKSSSQSQSRSTTHSPSGSYNYNYDELSDTKLLGDDVEIAVEALPNEPVEPVRRTLLVSSEEETSKESDVEKELSPSIESDSSTNNASGTEQSVNNHHPVARKCKSFPNAGDVVEDLSPQDRLRMLLSERKNTEQQQSQEQLNSVPPLLANLGPTAKKYANRKRSHSITWAIGGEPCRSDVGKLKRALHQHTSNSESSDNIVTDDLCSSTPLNEMSTSCISHNTLVSLDSASTLVPGSPTVSQPDLQDLTLSESYPESRNNKTPLCLSCQYHHRHGRNKDDHVVNNSLSPLNTLDQYIRCGGRLHHYTSLNIPLTSFEYVDWDHFGGCPHQEAVSVMMDQVMLLHSQLLFERNQCLQHATRNRRLLSMMHKSSADKEDLLAMRDQVHIMEQTVESKDINIGILKEKLRQLTEENAKKEESLIKHLWMLKEDKQRQDCENCSLQGKLHKLEAQNAVLEKELMSADSRIFNLEARLKQSEPLLQKTKELQAQVESLKRELLVVNEVQHHQQFVDTSKRKSAASQQHEMMCEAYKRERDVAQAKVDELSQQLQEMNMKFDELQNKMKSKDERILTLEKSISTVKERCAAKLKMNEDSYNTIKSTCKQQESYILELQGQIGRTQQTTKHGQVCHKRCCSNPIPPIMMAESSQ